MSRSLNSFIESPLCEIHFAGFRAHALELQHRGWEVSGYEKPCFHTYAKEISLCLRHSTSGLTFMSSSTVFELDQIMRGKPANMMNRAPVFNINGITFDGRTRFVERVDPFIFDMKEQSFEPLDLTPNIKRIDLDKFDLSKFGIFRKLNDSANIFLEQATAHELMEEILKKQSPKQREIREKRRKREAYGELFERNPNDEIKLQLIAV